MFLPHSFRRVCALKAAFDKQTITNALYIIIFIFLVTYSIFNTLYIQNRQEPHEYDMTNVAVKRIGCTFPISEQYQRSSRYICYLLLLFTVVIRNHRWLAVGAATSVLTYSGVAAIHSIILSASNRRFNPAKTKTRCEALPIPGVDNPFLACDGVSDPDIGVIMIFISGVMLGALPMAAWSTAFRKSARKPILIIWLLLLALGHSLYYLTKSDVNLHYQICPRDTLEPIPRANFQPSPLDQTWRNSFYSLVSMTNQSIQLPENSTPSTCIYSCFATTAYDGRMVQDISVVDYTTIAAFTAKSLGKSVRHVSIFFWWFYTLLALMTLYTTEKVGRLPKFVHKRVFTLNHRQKPLELGSYISRTFTPTVLTTSSTILKIQGAPAAKCPITVLTLIQLTTQIISAVAFCLFVIIEDFWNQSVWDALEHEPLAAVGQWSSIAVVLMVLLAAGVSRTLGGRGAKAAIVTARSLEAGADDSGTIVCSSAGGSPMEGVDPVDPEMETWDWRVGYAS